MPDGFGGGPESRGWLDGLEPVLDCLAADIRSDLHREPDTGDLLLVLLNSLNTVAAEAASDSVKNYASLKQSIDELRLQRAAAERRTRERLAALDRDKEAAIAARDFERAEQLHTEQIQIGLKDEKIANARHRLVIDFCRVVLGITDGLGNRRAIE
jgi:hypothetical protein